MQNQNYQEFEEQEINFTDYLNIVARYKWIAISLFVAIVGISFLYTARSPRIYKTKATVLLEENRTSDLFIASYGTNTSTINNNIYILKSRPVVTLIYKLMQGHDDFERFPVYKLGAQNAVSHIIQNLSIETERDTDLLFINAESTYPIEAKEIANSAARALQQQDTDYARTEFRSIREFLSLQLDDQERNLREAEEQLRSYKIEHGISMLSEETTALIERSSELEKLLAEAKTDLNVSTQHLAYLKKELSGQDSLLTDVNITLNTPFLEELKTEIILKQAEYLRLLIDAKYPETHPDLVSRKKSIEDSKETLKTEIQKTLLIKAGSADPLIYRSDLIGKISIAQIEHNIKQSKVKGLKKAVENYNSQMSILPDTEIQLARFTRNTRMSEKIYSMLVEKYENAKIVEKSKVGKIRIVEEAMLPTKPIKPNKKMNLMIALILGVGAGVGTALMLHSFDSKIRTFDDMKRSVALPILGTIPHILVSDDDLDQIENLILKSKDSKKDGLKAIKQRMVSRLISSYAPKSSSSEAFRILRTNLLSQRKNGNPLSILISSSGPREGKSTVISNLAITLAQMDAKVILLDLDLRRPVLHKLFGIEKKTGMSDYLLSENAKIEDSIKETGVKNLSVITCGIIPPNPSELLASQKMLKTIQLLKEKYDYVIIDSPPVIAVTDSMVLSKHVDMLVLAVRVDLADKKVLKRTKELIDNIGANINGVIVNGIKPRNYYSRYEYNYYYYYYYGDSDSRNADQPNILRKNKSLY
ncbi:MAG: polysaccharide biosynthesis tyrosine autokinase [Candidatus Cloacimonetes bacterium]|jgi:capsular exopolysaccharide synthesis family protein|nr:polysaccharide biosynthesis tyrosine autokinase [Candidatus Cloacimonadota bacterium]MBT6993381.1 polysaccharide biosynthesis tyrosine autokinase [Candidatus Cloacimonadota bacterium]